MNDLNQKELQSKTKKKLKYLRKIGGELLVPARCMKVTPAKFVKAINDNNAEMTMKRIKQKTRITPSDRVLQNSDKSLCESQRERRMRIRIGPP